MKCPFHGIDMDYIGESMCVAQWSCELCREEEFHDDADWDYDEDLWDDYNPILLRERIWVDSEGVMIRSYLLLDGDRRVCAHEELIPSCFDLRDIPF